MRNIGLLAVAALAVSVGAPTMAKDDDAGKRAERVVRQPLKDVGIIKEKPEDLLLEAQKAPYSLAGLRTCVQLRREIARYNEALGPDVDDVDDKGDPLAGRLTEAGASSVVNSIIPLRGLVREATGAASADRRQRAAILSGMARRAFLKGNATAKGCRF